ncbi:hypothetical protein [Roseibium alexandrii]|uniref:Endonuclease/exonuclease/phosphatase family protein n=1 Tax=Roseibium alexandrii TaxID=388408 RepID=A0A0M6ZZ22_9HYPH|nr:hypothetical protein [Roseibium alexandrii]CTQ67466.1 hypothetical protein LAX5112_01403 [Roseibium alexandrii]
MRPAIALLFWLLAAGGALAQSADPIPGTDVIAERVADPQISGALVAGAVFTGGASVDWKPALHAVLPADWPGGTVCVHARSLDASYERKRYYEVGTDWAGRPAPLGYPTQYPEYTAPGREVPEDAAAHIATAISPGACDREPGGGVPRVLVGDWNTRPEPGRDVRLYINSQGASAAFIYAGTHPGAIACRPVANEHAKTFDHVCPIPAAALTPPVTPLELSLRRGNRYDLGRYLDLVTAVAAVDGGN